MTLNRSADFELVVLKKSGDSDKKNARFEVSEPEDPNSHYMSLLRKKRNAVSQYTDVTNRSKGDSGSSVLKNVDASENYEKEIKAETLGNQYLNWNPPHIKPAVSTKGLKRLLCLAALSGLVCVLLVLTGTMVLGGVNKNAQTKHQEESVKEAEIFSRMINNLTTQMRSLEETLRQTRADLVDSAALLEVRLNRTDRNIESLTANTSRLRSDLSSQVETAERNFNSRISSLDSSFTSTRADIQTAEMNYLSRISRLNSSLDRLKNSLGMVNAFSRCNESILNCSPMEHSTNQFLYSCSTNRIRIIKRVSQ